MKKTLSAAVAVILAMVTLLCSCSSAQHSAEQEYLDKIIENFEAYRESTTVIYNCNMVADADVSQVEEAVKNGMQAIDNIEKLTVPEGFEEEHKMLVKWGSYNRKALEYETELFNYNMKSKKGTITDEEMERFNKLSDEKIAIGRDDEEYSSKSYRKVVLEVIDKLNKAGCTGTIK